MTNTITIGKRLIPLEHIALVEPFDPSAHPGMKTEKAFKARVVLIDRMSVLTEEEPGAFAGAHGFRMLAGEQVATNPSVRFSVERFEPAEGFEPNKPFLARLSWRDLDGNTQSKLLLSTPEIVLATVVKGEADAAKALGEATSQARRAASAASGQRRSRRREAQPA